MDIFYGFKVCRLCLTPSCRVKLSSMIEGDREKAKTFENVGGIDVSPDFMKHEVLICDSCWPILEKVDQFRSTIKGKIAFENKRDEATGSSSKDSRRTRMKICFCRCCLADSFHVNLKVMNGSKTKKLKDISGVDVSKDEGNQAALVCSQCSLFIDKTYNIRVDIKQVDEFYFCFRREEVEESIRLKEINNVKIKKEKVSPERDMGIKVQLKSTQKRKIVKEVTRKRKAPEIKKEFPDSKKRKVETKKWKCKICLKYYSSRNSLKEHLERIHAKIKRFSCDICGLSEYLKQNLRAHMIRRHINPTVKPRRFYDKSRPFKCNVPGCSKFFKRKSDLDYHLRIHAGVKPYVCFCNKAFTFKFELNGHRKRHHNDV